VSLRGTLMAISISMLTGLGFNCISKKWEILWVN
jgi:hypothetical protein